MGAYLETQGDHADVEAGGYCPECGQRLNLTRQSRRRGSRFPRWAWAIVGLGLLLAVGFAALAWDARRGILVATDGICGQGTDREVAAADDRAAQCLRDDRINYLRNRDWLLVNLDAARTQLAVATHGLVAAALVLLLGYSALTRPRPVDLDVRLPWALRAWVVLEQVGFAVCGLLVVLGALALVHLIGSGAPLSPDLLAHAVRVAVDAPFQGVILSAGAPGS